MKKIKMGGRIECSAISLGCMRLARIEQEQADRLIDQALECGINYFDHADVYGGGGGSERRFGDYLKRHPSAREKMIVQTKVGVRSRQYDLSKDYILSAVDASLERLSVDYIDALLLHHPDTLVEPEEVAEAFEMLHQSGKVRYFGVSNHNLLQVELLKTAFKQPLIANQLRFSITEAGMVTSGMNVNMKNEESVMRDGGLLEYSRLTNMTIQVWSPFQSAEHGVFIDNEAFPELNTKLAEIAERYNVSKSAVATAWILRHPANMQVIAGTTKPERLADICTGADITLTRKEWYEIYLSAGHSLP